MISPLVVGVKTGDLTDWYKSGLTIDAKLLVFPQKSIEVENTINYTTFYILRNKFIRTYCNYRVKVLYVTVRVL